MDVDVDRDLLQRSSLTRKIKEWQRHLVEDEDMDSPFLLDGISHGFKLVSDLSQVVPAESRNYRSAITQPAKSFLDKLFRDELRAGKIEEVQKKPRRLNAIGAVPKAGTNSFRPITDCSRPTDCSVNSYIEPESFRFESIDDALELSTPGCYFAVVDIKAAYRSVPVFPAHRELQGFCWAFEGEHEKFYVDHFLCFGLSNAPSIFQRVSGAIARIMRRQGHQVVVYLDDFLLIGSSWEECLAAQHKLIGLLTSLGFEVKLDKVVGPVQRIGFLGLTIDSIKQNVELPEEKVNRLAELCSLYAARIKVSKVELQQIVGHMSFAARAVYGARTFSRIFVDALSTLEKPGHRIRITNLIRDELRWWTFMASRFNGMANSVFGIVRPEMLITTDAYFGGFGCKMDPHWLFGTWEDGLKLPAGCKEVECNRVPAPRLSEAIKKNINFLEMVASCIAVLSWQQLLEGHMVVVSSDNTSTVAFLNRGTTKNPEALGWLKLVFYASVRWNFRVRAIHCPGVENVEADALSRISDSTAHATLFQKMYGSHFPGPSNPDISDRYPRSSAGETTAGFASRVYGVIQPPHSNLAVEGLHNVLPEIPAESFARLDTNRRTIRGSPVHVVGIQLGSELCDWSCRHASAQRYDSPQSEPSKHQAGDFWNDALEARAAISEGFHHATSTGRNMRSSSENSTDTPEDILGSLPNGVFFDGSQREPLGIIRGQTHQSASMSDHERRNTTGSSIVEDMSFSGKCQPYPAADASGKSVSMPHLRDSRDVGGREATTHRVAVQLPDRLVNQIVEEGSVCEVSQACAEESWTPSRKVLDSFLSTRRGNIRSANWAE